MVDSFPSNPADPDHALQLRINEDLQNAERLKAAFERAFPEDPGANVRTLVQRTLQRPEPSALYLRLAAAKPNEPWLLPLVRRFGWNQAQGEPCAAWATMLAEMLFLALPQVRQVGEPEFVALGEATEGLLAHRRIGYLGLLAGFACRLEKTGPLRAPVVDTLRQLLRFCDPLKGSAADRERLLWPLFRSDAAFDAGDRCWRARVRRDLAAMEPKLGTNWLKVFDPESRASTGIMKTLGSAQLEAGLRQWIGMLRDQPEPLLSSDDSVVLRHLLTLCDLLGGSACDELLYEVARAPWTEKSDQSWMPKYLDMLRSRPQNRAFACLEALMMNPVTAIDVVRRQYEALLAVFGAEATAESPVGVDGFPLDSDPRLVMIQSLKEEDMTPARRAAIKAWEAQMTRPVPWFPVAPEVTDARKAMEAAILEEFSADPESLNRALTTRTAWIRAHQHEYSQDALQLWNEWLHGLGCGEGLVGRSLTKVDELSLESLLGAIQACGNSSKVFELCQKYVARHGWHADLVEPFRQFIPRLGVPSDRTENARAEWFLWFENVAPIEVPACWSYRVKQDIRSMPSEEASAWRALLDNPAFVITGKPPAKWMKAAEKLFPNVGLTKFRPCFVQWFEPFAKGEPLRITITGRNILRVLMWYALIAKDDVVDQAFLGFAKARWKTKQCAQRVAQAEMAFGYVLGQRQPKGALQILEALVESGQAFEGSTTHRVYQELCARQNRAPVKAIPLKVNPAKEPAPNPILDNLTVGEFRKIISGLDPRSAK